ELRREGRYVELRHGLSSGFVAPQKTKRIRKAMARPKRPVASASAKPRNANGCTCPCDAGLRATELISAENTLPMPIPAPTRAMQARPAPIILAEARSMCVFPLFDDAADSLNADGERRADRDR